MKHTTPPTLTPAVESRAFELQGFYSSLEHPGTVWLRDRAFLHLPHSLPHKLIRIEGTLLPPTESDPASKGNLGLSVAVGKVWVGRESPIAEGPFSIEFRLPEENTDQPFRFHLEILGVKWTNAKAFLGRVGTSTPGVQSLVKTWQPYRGQSLNRRLRIRRIFLEDDLILDFEVDYAPFNFEITQRFFNYGINIVGWFDAALGIGESARLSAQSAHSAGISTALVPLRLNCKSPRLKEDWSDRTQDSNPFPFNLFHLDAPQAVDIDHHHGRAFRRGKYNIAYLAWELPEFPDSWIRYLRYFHEIWVPSRFVQESIGRKSPVPVLTMPHAIDFPLPDLHGARQRFGLPGDRFLFLFIYDLNSYQARKNPEGALRAYIRATEMGLEGSGLVIKVHSVKGNEKDFARLVEQARSIPNVWILNEALSRTDVYRLEGTCDAFVSLHRSEGFGLCVAESMLLGKPVIATDWSATSEFLNHGNGCPVSARLTELDRNHGPYAKGQIWAEPDIQNAAEWMCQLAGNRALAARLGENARRTILDRFSFETIGSLYHKRLKALLLA